MATEIPLWLLMVALGMGIAGLWAFLDGQSGHGEELSYR